MKPTPKQAIVIFALILGITRLWLIFFIVLALLAWSIGPALIRFSNRR